MARYRAGAQQLRNTGLYYDSLYEEDCNRPPSVVFTFRTKNERHKPQLKIQELYI